MSKSNLWINVRFGQWHLQMSQFRPHGISLYRNKAHGPGGEFWHLQGYPWFACYRLFGLERFIAHQRNLS